VPLSAFALALGAAFLHASWNVLLAGARDSEAATAVATLAGVVLLAPVAIAVGDVQSSALPFAGASAALHVAYLGLLARAYQGGQVSVVYPVSRGVAPVLVLVFGAAVLSESASAGQAAGVLAVSAGVFLVGGRRAGKEGVAQGAATPAGPSVVDRARAYDAQRSTHSRDLLFGLAIALTIATYTLVDAEGVDRARAPSYLLLLLGPSAIVYAVALGAAGKGQAMRAAIAPQTVLAGAFIVGAYGCVLAALRLADAAPVAAVRESSVVIAAILAAVFLHEDVDARRLGGALAVVAGVAAIAYS
jgi:drug/metabolite transporter (DMT)-like permease